MTTNKYSAALYSIMNNRCPRCHGGRVFEVANPFDLKKGMKMNPVCSRCSQSFEPEPGFYYGAMYTSYGFSVGVGFAVFLVLSFFNVSTFYSIIGCSISLIVLIPVFFRWGRLTWLNLFVGFKGKTSGAKA